MKARLVALSCLVAATGAAPALGYWHAGGTGTGLAVAATLPTGTQPTVTLAARTTTTVQWTQVSFAGALLGTYAGGGYSIARYPAAGGSAVTPNTSCDTAVSGSTATLSCQEDAVPVGSWKYSVTPILASWTGTESPRSVQVDVLPAAPSLSSASAQNPSAGQTTGNIQLSWSGVTAATGYNVYRRTGAGSYDYAAPLNGAAPVTGTTYTDPGAGLTGGTTYTYVVRAVAGSLQGASSNELSASPIARPAAPGSVTATPAPAGAINTAWSSVSGVAGYNVYRRTSTGSYNYATPLNGSTPITATSYADTGTTNATAYRYLVRSVITGAGDAQVESADSTESTAATADATPPNAVSLNDPGSPLRGSITLAGSASDAGSGIATVRFEHTPAGGATWTNACTAAVAPYSCSFATTAVTDGLYDLRIVATDAAGNTTTSAIIANRRIDNAAPSVTMGDPGAYLRATVSVTATATDGGSGVASVRMQRAATGSSTWTDVCTTTTSPYTCALNTTTLADGGYDLRAIATDVAGNTTTSTTVVNRIIDNTAPTGTDIQTTSVLGGTAAKPETGDVVTYTFSEQLRPTSVLAGWNGSATVVTVRFTNGSPDVFTVFDPTNMTQLALGSFTSGKKYVVANTTFSSSTMTLTGNTITVTLGIPSGATATANGTTTLQWITSTSATDLAGNPVTAATVAETGLLDLDF